MHEAKNIVPMTTFIYIVIWPFNKLRNHGSIYLINVGTLYSHPKKRIGRCRFYKFTYITHNIYIQVYKIIYFFLFKGILTNIKKESEVKLENAEGAACDTMSFPPGHDSDGLHYRVQGTFTRYI